MIITQQLYSGKFVSRFLSVTLGFLLLFVCLFIKINRTENMRRNYKQNILAGIHKSISFLGEGEKIIFNLKEKFEYQGGREIQSKSYDIN